MTASGRERTCALAACAGRRESCSDTCVFWEPGGAVLAGRCAFDAVDLSRRPELVHELLELRDSFFASSPASRPADLRHLLHRALNRHGDE